MRRCLPATASCLIIIFLAIAALPRRSEAQVIKRLAHRAVFLERTSAENVDLGAPGPSPGDFRSTVGVVRATQNGEVIGSYSTSQHTLATGLDGGKEKRSVMMEITIGKSDITMLSAYDVPTGGPPAARVVHPIIGGTGAYFGANGSLTLIPIGTTGYRAVMRFAPRG